MIPATEPIWTIVPRDLMRRGEKVAQICMTAKTLVEKVALISGKVADRAGTV